VPEARRLPRRSRAETRELLLLAGTLLADDAVARTDDALLGEWLSHVRFDDVLRVATQLQLYLDTGDAPVGPEVSASARTWQVRAHRDQVLAVDASGHRGIAKSTAYTAFDNERDFREQLARALLTSERVRDASVMGNAHAALTARPGGPPPLGEAFGEIVTHELARIGSFAAPTVEVGAIAFAGHPLIRELLARITEEATDLEVGTSIAAVYQQVLDAYGWQLRGGLTIADLVLALRALLLGYLVIGRVWPEGLRDEVPWGPEDTNRSAMSLAVEGVVRRFAAPVDADPVDEGSGDDRPHGAHVGASAGVGTRRG
jgi:hypothetical protein